MWWVEHCGDGDIVTPEKPEMVKLAEIAPMEFEVRVDLEMIEDVAYRVARGWRRGSL